jgi:hypothetical protein
MKFENPNQGEQVVKEKYRKLGKEIEEKLRNLTE